MHVQRGAACVLLMNRAANSACRHEWQQASGSSYVQLLLHAWNALHMSQGKLCFGEPFGCLFSYVSGAVLQVSTPYGR